MPDRLIPRPPRRRTGRAVAAMLVAAWTSIRLVVFDAVVFPLTYVLPLLVCVWTRDRAALWMMAAGFAGLHVVNVVWFPSDHGLTPSETSANLFAVLANIVIGALAVDLTIRLLQRVEGAHAEVQAQADELQGQNEELAQQAEHLSQQTTELTQQGEELASQNEELHSQAEEIGGLVAALENKERLLGSLLDATRLSSTEDATLQHIATAARELFGNVCDAAAVYEHLAAGLSLRAFVPSTSSIVAADHAGVADDFARLVTMQNRTAALNDIDQRPDIHLLAGPDGARMQAVLAAPIRFDDRAVGAFAIYCQQAHDWSEEEFRLAAWLADQCGRALQALRVQASLRTANQRKNEFLATLSHELRNPLAPIRFALTLIQQGKPSEKPLQIVERQFHHLVRLIDDLLDATRFSSNKVQLRKTRCDLVTIVQQAIDASAHAIEGAHQTLATTLPSEPVWLYADPDRLGQVVTNLLNNATRYTPANGRLSVSLTASASEACLMVSDSGIGLSPEDAGRIFDMFTQAGGAGSGGLGLGLAIVRGIVELHGGHVEAHSNGANQGSEFRVRLPLTVLEPVFVSEPAILPKVQSPPLRVLVVDDNVDSAEMMATLLEVHGHTVAVATNAESALQAAIQMVPDVALLDIGMPGMDGYMLARRLREDTRTPPLRLIAVTGFGQESDRTRARDAGFDGHLTKPAEPDAILAALSPEAQPK